MGDLVGKAKDIIEKISYITIATSSSGQPWNSPVFSAHDESYNFYWASWRENTHSKNILENPSVFLVIYDSTVPEGTGEGVYIKAVAKELKNKDELEKAVELLYAGKDHKRKPEEFKGKYPRRVYKATPQQAWVNVDGDINGNYVDKRVEIKL